MMSTNLWRSALNGVVVFAMLAGSATAAFAADPTERELKGTELIVHAMLDELDAPPAIVDCRPNPILAAAFPGYLFVAANFPNVPPEDLPEPLKPHNVFAVSPDGKASLLATPADVLDLFARAGKPVKSADDAKKAAEAALALEQAKYPDQPFKTPADGVQAMPDGMGGYNASGTSQPTPPANGQPGGNGPITTNLSFGRMGPTKINTTSNYRPPARRNREVTKNVITNDTPIAQKAAGGPVTNINSPTINKSLPGKTFFTPKPNNGKQNPQVVAVGEDGKPQTFDSLVELGKFVRAQYGPVKTEQQAREVMKAYLTLATGLFPAYQWAPVQDSDIHVKPTGKGGLDVDGKVFVANNPNQWIMGEWKFNKQGQPNGSQRAVNLPGKNP